MKLGEALARLGQPLSEHSQMHPWDVTYVQIAPRGEQILVQFCGYVIEFGTERILADRHMKPEAVSKLLALGLEVRTAPEDDDESE